MRKYVFFVIIAIIICVFLNTHSIHTIFIPLIRFIWNITYPFLIAIFIAYLLSPIILQLEKLGIKRAVAIILLFVWMISSIIFTLYVIYPYFITQLDLLANELPIFFSNYEQWMEQVHHHMDTFPSIMHNQFYELVRIIEETVEYRLHSFIKQLTNVFDLMITVTIVPIIIFYLLRDGHDWENKILNILSEKQRTTFIQLRDLFDHHLGKYLYSQMIVFLIIAILMFVVYYLLQIPFPLLFALFAGIMNIIPYIGPFIGAIPAIIAAFSIGWPTLFLVVVFTLVVQLLEGAVISPYVIGKQIELHPILVIVAVMIGAELGGIIGMVIMIPIFSMVKAFLLQKINRKDVDIDIS